MRDGFLACSKSPGVDGASSTVRKKQKLDWGVGVMVWILPQELYIYPYIYSYREQFIYISAYLDSCVILRVLFLDIYMYTFFCKSHPRTYIYICF